MSLLNFSSHMFFFAFETYEVFSTAVQFESSTAACFLSELSTKERSTSLWNEVVVISIWRWWRGALWYRWKAGFGSSPCGKALDKVTLLNPDRLNVNCLKTVLFTSQWAFPRTSVGSPRAIVWPLCAFPSHCTPVYKIVLFNTEIIWWEHATLCKSLFCILWQGWQDCVGVCIEIILQSSGYQLDGKIEYKWHFINIKNCFSWANDFHMNINIFSLKVSRI